MHAAGRPCGSILQPAVDSRALHSHQKRTEQIRSDHNLEAIDKALIRPIRQITKKAVRSVNFPMAYSEKRRPSGLAFPIWHHLRPAARVSMPWLDLSAIASKSITIPWQLAVGSSTSHSNQQLLYYYVPSNCWSGCTTGCGKLLCYSVLK